MERWLAAGVGMLLVAAAGCAMAGDTEGGCTEWTRTGGDRGLEVHLHVRNERPQPACLQLRFSGDRVAKVPLGEPGGKGGQPVEDERTITTAQPRLTVRVVDLNGDAWVADAVDVRQTPHLQVTVGEDGIRLETLQQAP